MTKKNKNHGWVTHGPPTWVTGTHVSLSQQTHQINFFRKPKDSARATKTTNLWKQTKAIVIGSQGKGTDISLGQEKKMREEKEKKNRKREREEEASAWNWFGKHCKLVSIFFIHINWVNLLLIYVIWIFIKFNYKMYTNYADKMIIIVKSWNSCWISELKCIKSIEGNDFKLALEMH